MNVVYVDEKDQEIGSGSIADAIENGIRVRIARVFLTNSEGELLIQKRADSMNSLPGKWDQTAAGHVDEGEVYTEAAARELLEEMGISGVGLHETATFYTEETDESKTKKRFNKIFVGTYNGEVAIDNDEVSGYKWIDPEELEKQMSESPQNFTDGFIEAFKVYNKQ
jgi:isopentenyldiphosphate isomerase